MMNEADVLVDFAPSISFRDGDPVIRSMVRDIEQNRVDLLSAATAGPGVIHFWTRFR
jgi:hypothetical protein